MNINQHRILPVAPLLTTLNPITWRTTQAAAHEDPNYEDSTRGYRQNMRGQEEPCQRPREPIDNTKGTVTPTRSQ